MKIKKISPICIHMPLINGKKKLEFNFVKIEMDNGIIGWGEAFGYISWKVVKTAIEEMITPKLIGKKINKIEDIEKISNEIQKSLHIFGRYGVTIYALSGVEIGLWDALGKEKNLPIHKMLGETKKNEFKAYASLFRYSDRKIIETKCKNALDDGFKIIKLHEVENKYIEAARKFIGDNIPLMTDVNCEWSYDEALSKKDFLKKINLLWLEEPIFPPEDFKSLSLLRKNLGTSIALGENACTEWEFQKILESGAADYIQPSVIKVGGISEMMKVIRLSEKYKTPVMPHSAYFGPGFLASLHLASQTSLETYIERYYLDIVEEFYPEFKSTSTGTYKLPNSPGLGLDFDEKIIDKFKV